VNKQEKMWNGGFGTEYHQRNKFEDRMGFWTDILGMQVLNDAWSVLEPGAGKGENLLAIQKARKMHRGIEMDSTRLTGIEINEQACAVMRREGINVMAGAFLSTPLNDALKYPLVITRGFLMHVPKPALQATLAKIYNASSHYICIVEYYSPVRREVEYHGHTSALWIDDFAGDIMEMYPDLKLLDYGFKYYKDRNGNDLTYFLMEK
jgi:spore coat polysaccharide biosynthesis protein SpsF